MNTEKILPLCWIKRGEVVFRRLNGDNRFFLRGYGFGSSGDYWGEVVEQLGNDWIPIDTQVLIGRNEEVEIVAVLYVERVWVSKTSTEVEEEK